MDVQDEQLTGIQQINVRLPVLIKNAFTQLAIDQEKYIKDQANEAILCYIGFKPWPAHTKPVTLSEKEKEFVSYYGTSYKLIPKSFLDYTNFPQGKPEQVNIRISVQTSQVLKIVAQIQKKYLEVVVTEAFLEYLDILPRQTRNYSHLTNLVH